MKHFEGIEVLNVRERKFLACLKAVNHDSAWGMAIGNVMKDPSVLKLRKLIGELKSQAADDRGIMLDILGETCYDQLLNL